MTLSKQLMLLGFGLLLCLFLGLIIFTVENTQEYMDKQLDSHAQDTATALGLSLTSTMKEQDAVMAERIVAAVFDRGYYSSIVVEDNKGNVSVSKTYSIQVHDVPDWFISFLNLSVVQKEALIMDGWTKWGTVYVKSNPGYAYRQIWITVVDSVQWFILTAIAAVVFGGIILYFILKPLHAITKQAYEICNQQFSIVKNLPWTLDLRQVVEAMNNMSKRLKKLFEEQARSAELYREQAYKDQVTKLGNRRYFDMQFDYLLQNNESAATGVLVLIELKEFKEYNDNHGYEAGDSLLINVAQTLNEICGNFENVVIGHIGGASFGVILPNKTKEVGVEISTKISQAFNEYESKQLCFDSDVGHIGVVLFHPEDVKKDLLSQADMSLRHAQSEGPNAWHFIEAEERKQTHGAQEWSKIFVDVLQQNLVVLHFQKTELFNEFKNSKSYETLMRLNIEDQLVSAGIFMPMAERLHQITALDRLVVENIINKVLHVPANYLFTINLSPTSLDDESFVRWFLEKAKSLGKKANQLVIELPEYGVINRIETVRELFLQFSILGGYTSIDHYGKNFSSFAYLHNLKIKFLKLDGGFIKNVDENEENQFFIRSLIDIAHSLDILVIAEAVETQKEFEVLKNLKVDGAQGYFIAKPAELKAD
jgi:diguanylate cyclase (GGDEF)-like protein